MRLFLGITQSLTCHLLLHIGGNGLHIFDVVARRLCQQPSIRDTIRSLSVDIPGTGELRPNLRYLHSQTKCNISSETTELLQ